MRIPALVWWVYEDKKHVSEVGKSDRVGGFGEIGKDEQIKTNYIVSNIGFSDDDIKGPRFVGFIGRDYGYSSSTVGHYFIGDIE